jgi:O-Antigen ligase
MAPTFGHVLIHIQTRVKTELKRMLAIYHCGRRYGPVVVLLTLALSLVVDFGGVGFLGAFLAICLLFSGGRSILDSIRSFDRIYRTSDPGKIYVLIVLYVGICLFLTFHHNDDTSVVETAIKQMVIAYTIFFHFEKYDAGVVFVGAALGAIFAGGAAVYDHYFLSIARAEGVTNPIRFGFIAALFGALALVGLLFDRRSRAFAGLMTAGALAGVAAAYLSASMGTAIAILPMLLMIFLRLWNRSKANTAWAVVLVFAVLAGLVTMDIGSMRSRIALAVANVKTSYEKDSAFNNESARLRLEMLQISRQLFRDNPVLGVGSRGWDAAVGVGARAEDGNAQLRQLNQPHNQFANDLAKGGIVRGAAGLALFVLPLFLFVRRRPFSSDPATVPALAGLVTCVGFLTLGLTESVLVLSLPACLYILLLCFLMASQRPAGALMAD